MPSHPSCLPNHSLSSPSFTYFAQSCVPFGTIPITSSATTFVTAQLVQVRAIVDSTSHPPGFTCGMIDVKKEAGCVTCSSTSNKLTMSNCSLSVFGSGSCSTLLLRYVSRPGLMSSGSRFACACATASTSVEGSMAVTERVVGRRPADSAKIPPPQPISR